MHKFLLGCSIAIFTAAAAPASAGTGASAAATGGQDGVNRQQAASVGGSTQAVAEKKVCRHLPSSYSRRTQKVCLTSKEWAEVEREAQ